MTMMMMILVPTNLGGLGSAVSSLGGVWGRLAARLLCNLWTPLHLSNMDLADCGVIMDPWGII